MPRIIAPCLALLLAVLSAVAVAQEPQIGELSSLDRQFMQQQRDLLQELAALRLGRRFSGERERDLALLQALLDRDIVRPDQTRELQAMGVILGDHLAADLDLHWVVYEDQLGRSRALRYRDSDTFLFPVTMIARRLEGGAEARVNEIYRKASDTVEHLRPALPYR